MSNVQAPAYLDPNVLFDKDIFTLLGVPDASQDQKDRLMDTVMQSVNNRVFSRVLDMIDDESAPELEKLLENDGDVAAFLQGEGINLATVTAQEALLYKTELITLVATSPLPSAAVPA